MGNFPAAGVVGNEPFWKGDVESMETAIRAMGAMLLVSFLSIAGTALFKLVPKILALAALGYGKPWLPVLPFGTEYAFADLALGGSDCLYVSRYRVPARFVRWHGAACFLLCLVPVLSWIAALAMRAAIGGPCMAWALASLEGGSTEEKGLKGAVAAAFPLFCTVMLIVALARNGARE